MMQTADTGAMQSDNDSLTEEIRAAQEALEKAGIELQTAGGMLETASTDAELAQADAQLAKARLSVIIAGQDLLDLQEVLEGSVDEDIFSDAQESLNDANAAIIIATESIFSTRISLPEFEKQQSQGGGSGSQDGDSELDKELNESIAIFEGKILEARNEVIGGTPAPTSSENIPGVVVLGGSDIGGEEEGSFEDADPDNPIVIEQGRMPEGAEIAAVEGNVQVTIPDDIPPPQGDDIVAQQLREAAIAETDPELQKKLWEEYKKYKAGL
jgi:hypothetical protein